VAHRKTRKNHHPVKFHTPEPSLFPATTIISLIRLPRYNIPKPEQSCIGKIQLFLRPSTGLHTASTIGLHRSFSEYGYEANEKTPIWLYDRYGFSRKGTDPKASPIGMPCRKYSRTKRRKFLRSCLGRSKKLAFGFGEVGVGGTSSSRLKSSRFIKCAV